LNKKKYDFSVLVGQEKLSSEDVRKEEKAK